MIIVTGVNGQLGQAVAKRLLARVPPGQIVASVRDPQKAAVFAEKGVHVRAGDFTKPDELAAAFAGAEQVLVVSVDKLGQQTRQMHSTAIQAARAAGARRVLYTSHLGARAESPFAPASDHAATEAMLAEGGAPFTSLRHGFYAESALHLIGRGFEAGELRTPEDGPVSWTARADLAEADAILLAQEKQLDGITPPLTAPEAFTMADLAAVASEITGREIKHMTVTDDEWREARIAQGTPAMFADMLLGMYRAARRGDFAAVDPTLETLLGRRQRPCATCLPLSSSLPWLDRSSRAPKNGGFAVWQSPDGTSSHQRRFVGTLRHKARSLDLAGRQHGHPPHHLPDIVRRCIRSRVRAPSHDSIRPNQRRTLPAHTEEPAEMIVGREHNVPAHQKN